MAKYSKKIKKNVTETINEMKEEKLTSGSGDKVTDPKQAIAIALSEAREAGATVPKKETKKKEKGRIGFQREIQVSIANKYFLTETKMFNK